MKPHKMQQEEKEKAWLTLIRVPAVLLVALVILAIVGYLVTR